MRHQRYAAGLLLFGSQQQGVHIVHSVDACRIDAQLVQNISTYLKADGHRRWVIARYGNQLAIVPHTVPAVLAHSFFQCGELFQPIIQRFGSAVRGQAEHTFGVRIAKNVGFFAKQQFAFQFCIIVGGGLLGDLYRKSKLFRGQFAQCFANALARGFGRGPYRAQLDNGQRVRLLGTATGGQQHNAKCHCGSCRRMIQFQLHFSSVWRSSCGVTSMIFL